jgi:DNA replication protein DnaC
LQRLAREYTPARLEAACTRALAIRSPTYRSVASILKTGLDRQPSLFPNAAPALPPTRTCAGLTTTTDHPEGEPPQCSTNTRSTNCAVLRLDGMVRAIEDQASSAAATSLGFEERLTLLVQREVAWRDDRRVARLLKAARLKVSTACVEDINWRASRGLDKSLVTALAGCDWLRHGQSLLITGATGCGKTWLACALAHQAARSGFSVLYTRAARLFDELQVAHGDGSFARRLAQLAKLDLLVLDDFAISPIGAAERNDLLEVLDDRVGTRSTLITSQLPVKAWHTYLDDPTLADAILDRVVHSSHKIELKGRSLRDQAKPAHDERDTRGSSMSTCVIGGRLRRPGRGLTEQILNPKTRPAGASTAARLRRASN